MLGCSIGAETQSWPQTETEAPSAGQRLAMPTTTTLTNECLHTLRLANVINIGKCQGVITSKQHQFSGSLES